MITLPNRGQELLVTQEESETANSKLPDKLPHLSVPMPRVCFGPQRAPTALGESNAGSAHGDLDRFPVEPLPGCAMRIYSRF